MMKLGAFLLCVFALAVAGAGPAHADSAPVGGDIQVAQTLGERELTVIIRRADPIPGPLRVDVITHTGSPPGTLELRSVVEGTVISQTSVILGAESGFYGGTLRVDRAGPWELDVDDGAEVATIPFVLPAKIATPWEKATYGGFIAAGFFLLVALVLAVRSRRTGLTLIPAGGMVAAIAVAVTAALLSASAPPPPAPGSVLDPTIDNVNNPYPNTQTSTMDLSRPPVNLFAQADNASSGQEGELKLRFTDGSTGRAVDDLLVHDNAFVHLLVVSPSGKLWHLHPIRVAPGDYRANITPPEPGTYAISAELSRRGGGVQLVRSSVQIASGSANDPTPEPAGLGARVVGGNSVELTADVAPTGSPTTITAHFDTADLQPWLGMLGHMIVIGPLDNPAAPVWAHVHSLAPAAPGMPAKPDETVAAFGPDVPFTYSFPLPGRYRVWIQAERDFSVVTIPTVIDIPAAGGPR